MPPALPKSNHTKTTSWYWHEDNENTPEGLMAIRLLPGTHPVSNPRQLEENPGRLDYLALLLENSDAPERFRDWWNWVCFELDEEGGLIIYLDAPTYQPLEEGDLLERPSLATGKGVSLEEPPVAMPRLFD